MLTLASTSTFQTVFTASFAGSHTFVCSGSITSFQFRVGFVPPGGEDVGFYDVAPRSNGTFGQLEFVLHMQAGWQLSYKGNGGTLYGVRIGDEL
jgi:hypothetical protein